MVNHPFTVGAMFSIATHYYKITDIRQGMIYFKYGMDKGTIMAGGGNMSMSSIASLSSLYNTKEITLINQRPNWKARLTKKEVKK